MIVNQKARILWITDIHFSTNFKSIQDPEKNKLENFLQSFAQKIARIHKDRPLDYIFITGDLAQSGLSDDYTLLNDMLLKQLLTGVKGRSRTVPKVITIPGNHDVNWDEATFMKTYIGRIDLKLEKLPDRPTFLRDKPTEFKDLFKFYSAFITEQASGENASFFQLVETNEFKVSGDFAKDRLFGHIIDEKNKLVMVFLNTAWFSLGGQFNKLYFDYIKNNDGFSTTDMNLPNWLRTKDILTEYNTQITGIQLLDQKDLKYYFDNYPDYFKILVMHHPRNWLEWTESYSYPEDIKNNSAELLRELTNKADVVLSGHEHMPLDSNAERFFDDILHLKGGCFMEYEKLGPTFNHSWCSVLNVDTSTKQFEQEKHYYDPVNENWVLHQPTTKYNVQYKGNYPLTEERKKNVLNAYLAGTAAMFGAYLKAYFPAGTQLEGPDLIAEEKDGRYILYKITRGGVGEFCIFVKKENLFQQHFCGEDFFNEFTTRVIDDGHIERVRFVFLDIFVDGNLKINYDEEQCDRDTTFNHIVKQADAFFDAFRMYFYNKWEPVIRNGKPETSISFEPFKGLKFINHILPYVVAERYWTGR